MASLVETARESGELAARGFMLGLRPKGYAEKYGGEETGTKTAGDLLQFAFAASVLCTGGMTVLTALTGIKFNALMFQIQLMAGWLLLAAIAIPSLYVFVYWSSHKVPPFKNVLWASGQSTIASGIAQTLIFALPSIVLMLWLHEWNGDSIRYCTLIENIRSPAECASTQSKMLEWSQRGMANSDPGYWTWMIATGAFALWFGISQFRFFAAFFQFPSWRILAMLGWIMVAWAWLALLVFSFAWFSSAVGPRIGIAPPSAQREITPAEMHTLAEAASFAPNATAWFRK